MSDIHDQALALAGVAQFALYAHELATEGIDRRERLEAALHAIFCTDPDDAGAVFDTGTGPADGIRFLKSQLGGGGAPTPVVARYVGQILRLSARLQRDRDGLVTLRAAIERARLADIEDAPAILDAAYRHSISDLRPRVMVQGHPSYLDNALFTQRIRTHLLAAVRCAVLWRQCGGRMWRLFLQRRQLLAALG